MIKVGLLYGGRSGEHEVSLCSAASVFSSLDRGRYEVLAIGIDKDGRWYVQNPPEIVNDKDFGKILTIKDRLWLLNHFEDGNALCPSTDSGERAVVDVVFPYPWNIRKDGTLQGFGAGDGAVCQGGCAGFGGQYGQGIRQTPAEGGGIPVVPWITVQT